MIDEELAKKFVEEEKYVARWDMEQTDLDEIVKEAHIAGQRSKEEQLNKMIKYAKLLQDICDVMGGDIYMVSAGLESRVKTLWDSSEEKEGLRMVEDIERRLLEIKPQDWAEIDMMVYGC